MVTSTSTTNLEDRGQEAKVIATPQLSISSVLQCCMYYGAGVRFKGTKCKMVKMCLGVLKD